MGSVIDPAALGAALEEAKAYLRVELSDEDALIGRLVESSAALCEAFTGKWLMLRAGNELVPISGTWLRLKATPVKAISGVEAVPSSGSGVPLPAEAYAVDIDANGDGWVRVTQPGEARRARVSFEAGMAATWADVPEALRQGIIRLAAHLYSRRDGDGESAPPASVTALWRPWRRMRLG